MFQGINWFKINSKLVAGGSWHDKCKSEGSDLVAGQDLSLQLNNSGNSSAESSPRHHKPAHSVEDYNLLMGEESENVKELSSTNSE